MNPSERYRPHRSHTQILTRASTSAPRWLDLCSSLSLSFSFSKLLSRSQPLTCTRAIKVVLSHPPSLALLRTRARTRTGTRQRSSAVSPCASRLSLIETGRGHTLTLTLTDCVYLLHAGILYFECCTFLGFGGADIFQRQVSLCSILDQ